MFNLGDKILKAVKKNQVLSSIDQMVRGSAKRLHKGKKWN